MRLFVVALAAGVAVLAAAANSTGTQYKPGVPCAQRILHVGHKGECVKSLQWLLRGKKPLRKRWRGIRFFHQNVRLDASYGRQTKLAVRRAKYLLGYPARFVRGPYSGRQLWKYLVGTRLLTADYVRRQNRRLKFERQKASQGKCAYASWVLHSKGYMLDFCKKVAKEYGGPLLITSGYRPGSRVLGTGGLSQHATGDAIDISTPTYQMNREVGRAAYIAAGGSRSVSRTLTTYAGRPTGRFTVIFGCICWGDHTNHVHAGGPR